MKTSAAAPPHILLVDDNRDGLLIRRSLLEEHGYSVDVASGAEEGLKLFQETNFDVVVTDYRMPRMNGIELIKLIRAIKPESRIAILSGFVEPLGLTEANTGADAVVAKSANEPTHLIRAVKRLLSPVKRKPITSQKTPSPSRRAAAK